MDSMEFINNYELFLDEINQVIKPEFQTIIKELKETDPHDLVKPDIHFYSKSHARGLVWSLFLKRIKEKLRNHHI